VNGGDPASNFVENAAEAVDVRPAIEVGIGHPLLGTHVGRRTEGNAGRRELSLSHGAYRARDAEIGDERLPVLEEDILRLDVAVNYPVTVRVVERARDLGRDAQGFVERKLALAIESRAQRLAGDVRHDVVQLAVRLARVVDGEDVRVAKLCCELDLTTEAFWPEDEAELREEHFDRDLSMEPEVARQINRSHCPVTDFVLDLVVVSDGDFQAVERGRHAEGKGMAARLF